MAELLFWPALVLYGEAAVGYLGDAKRPGTAGRAAIWGVRLGWLVQTALLAVQAAREDGFPWGTWAGSLNLFVWLVVAAYLIWGCRRPYRLLGLAVMPLAAVLLVVSRAGGGTGVGTRSHYSNLFLVLFLFYAAYFMLRFSLDPGPQRANMSAVYALFGVVLIPVSFLAIRLAQRFIHPVVFTRNGPSFGGWMLVAYCVSQAAMLVLAYTLYRVELTGKRIDARLRELRLA